MMDFSPRVNAENPDPRIACVLVLDTSGSMAGQPIDQLNRGLELFCDEIKNDPLAAKRAEVSVITFGSVARVEIPFTEARDLRPWTLSASGATATGAALNLALDELAEQKQAYKQAGLEYYRPWLFILTDGAPTDGPVFASAAARVRETEAARGVSVFAIGVGHNADLVRLKEISAQRQPVRLDGLSFLEFFRWLSTSLGAASASNAFGSGDPEPVEQITLPPPTGWATA